MLIHEKLCMPLTPSCVVHYAPCSIIWKVCVRFQPYLISIFLDIVEQTEQVEGKATLPCAPIPP